MSDNSLAKSLKVMNNRIIKASEVPIGNRLTKGVRIDIRIEGSTRNLNSKRYWFLAYKLNKSKRTLTYATTVYRQTNDDTMDEHKHFKTALYRLETMPVVVKNIPDYLLDTTNDVVWQNQIYGFVSMNLVRCWDNDFSAHTLPLLPPPSQSQDIPIPRGGKLVLIPVVCIAFIFAILSYFV